VDPLGQGILGEKILLWSLLQWCSNFYWGRNSVKNVGKLPTKTLFGVSQMLATYAKVCKIQKFNFCLKGGEVCL